MKQHRYHTVVTWTGNRGKGTATYRAYERDHEIRVKGKMHPIMGASDPSFLGDPSRYNPEDLFLASLSACHMLWYLHLCSVHQIIVTAYSDDAEGLMEEEPSGAGRFKEVMLRPKVTIKHAADIAKADALHEQANKMCFIANSCNFKIGHQPLTNISDA